MCWMRVANWIAPSRSSRRRGDSAMPKTRAIKSQDFITLNKQFRNTIAGRIKQGFPSVAIMQLLNLAEIIQFKHDRCSRLPQTFIPA